MTDEQIIEFWKDKQAIDIELLMNDLPKFIEIIQKQKEEIEKKDKIIDLTITFICKNHGSDEDITNFVVSKSNKKEWTNLSDILKQYYERKVENGN